MGTISSLNKYFVAIENYLIAIWYSEEYDFSN